MEKSINLKVNYNKQILSSETKIYKTESFFYQTKKLFGIDNFVLKIAESIQEEIDNLVKFTDSQTEKCNCFKVKTIDGNFSFLFKLGHQFENNELIENKDIVFFKIESGNENAKTNDQRIGLFLRTSKIFNVKVTLAYEEIDESVFKKIYLISSSEYINFPMLNDKQRKLVEIEKENVLVQGVAGSGKTNVCISKLIYTACRNYSGKILYTSVKRVIGLEKMRLRAGRA